MSKCYLTIILAVIIVIFACPALAQSPEIYGQDGRYLGNLNNNRYDPNSVANPYGRYGSRYSADSVNNPYGKNGSAYSAAGANNPYGSNMSPEVRSADGAHLGPRKPEPNAAGLNERKGAILTKPGNSAESLSNSLATSEPRLG